jgi:hypothetical protein
MFPSPVNSSNNSAQYNVTTNSTGSNASIQASLNRPTSPKNNSTTTSSVPATSTSSSSVIIGGNEAVSVGPVTNSSISSIDMHHLQGHSYGHSYNTTAISMQHMQQTPINQMSSSSTGLHYNQLPGSTMGVMPSVHNQMPTHHHSSHHLQAQNSCSNQYPGHQYQPYHPEAIYNDYWAQVSNSTSTGYYDGSQVS